jgi:two-component system LytT family sensor kinase
MSNTWGMHLLLWMGYFCLEILSNFFHYPPDEKGRMLVDILQYMPFIVGSTYLIYLRVIPRFLIGRDLLRLTGGVLAVLLIIYAGRYLWATYDFNIGGERIYLLPWSKVVKNTIRDLGMVALMSSVLFIKDWVRQEAELRQVKKTNAEQRLELVIQQLQPHFLFNTINNIYSLIQSRPGQGAESLLQLSDVLEYFLHTEVNQLVSWEKERVLAEKYIDLHRLKYGDALNVRWENNLHPATPFPPFVLISLLENTFKHGGLHAGIFELEIDIRPWDDGIQLTVSNSISEHQDTGHARQRGDRLLEGLLEMHFGNHYEVHTNIRGNRYIVQIHWYAAV